MKPRQHWQIEIGGRVQGMGFRPFIFRQATALELNGDVRNTPSGVVIRIEGTRQRLSQFVASLWREAPQPARISRCQVSRGQLQDLGPFCIAGSSEQGSSSVLIPPDLAICPDCRREIFEPSNRRYRYPFTNCTQCGPRYTIIDALPYDRPRTVMSDFTLCSSCEEEYRNPADRRFHAQPNACPDCGPQVQLCTADRAVIASAKSAIEQAAAALARGSILALKGLGGYQLILDARNEQAIATLRQRKYRPSKPLAIMVRDLDEARQLCHIGEAEERQLQSPAAPIVLLQKRPGRLPESLAPGNPRLGLMLAYTPLHLLLLEQCAGPVVATSGNGKGRPICIDEVEAHDELAGIADLFLNHNRRILRQADDSIVQCIGEQTQTLRLARGFAPYSLFYSTLKQDSPHTLAVGAHKKNAMAIQQGPLLIGGQYLGDLEDTATVERLQQMMAELPRLYRLSLDQVVSDRHPGYASTLLAQQLGIAHRRIQHHQAHIMAGCLDNGVYDQLLGVCWDGTGLGSDGSLWGGEFFTLKRNRLQHVAGFRPFPLPGGSAAIVDTRRSAVGLLYQMLGDQVFDLLSLRQRFGMEQTEWRTLHRMLQAGLNSPLTSSAGRLFDAVAALLQLGQCNSFEGEAAMNLEFACQSNELVEPYPFALQDGLLLQIDWGPMVEAILVQCEQSCPLSTIAARFHSTLVEMVLAVAQRIDLPRVLLSGGCFQNRYLLSHTIDALHKAGYQPLWHRHIPCNDGGIALGQLVAADRLTDTES